MRGVVSGLLCMCQVAAGVHGPMMELLAREAAFHDPACLETFRRGGDFFGALAACGNGEAAADSEPEAARTRTVEGKVNSRGRWRNSNSAGVVDDI